MKKVLVQCPAKINLFLNIVSKDYPLHQMHNVNESVSLYDYLTIMKLDTNDIVLTSNNNQIPLDSHNSVYQAIMLFFSYTGLSSGIHVHIDKHIPLESGLGGESVDAAGAFLGLNTLFDTGLSLNELASLGFRVGSDVPYCIYSSTREVTGYGEVLKDYDACYQYFLIVTPPFSCSTGTMFSKYDSLNQYSVVPISLGYNDFHKVLSEEGHQLIQTVKDAFAISSFLTGSGSSVVGVFDNPLLLEEAYSLLSQKFDSTYQLFKVEKEDGVKVRVLS